MPRFSFVVATQDNLLFLARESGGQTSDATWAYSDVPLTSESFQLPSVASGAPHRSVPSRWVEVDQQIRLLYPEIDSFLGRTVVAGKFSTDRHRQARSAPDEFSDLELQSARPQASEAGGALRSVPEPLLRGRLPFVTSPAAPEDAVKRSPGRGGDVSVRSSQIRHELQDQLDRTAAQRRGPGGSSASQVMTTLTCAGRTA